MPHERLNALLASFIPLLPLLYQRKAQNIDWGSIVTHTKPFAPKYLPPVPELPTDQALANFYNHASSIDFMSGSRWLRDAISQPLESSLPVVDALGAFRLHFQVNVAASSLLLWVVGLLFLGLIVFFDRPGIPTSRYENMVGRPTPEGSPATRSLAFTSTSAEFVNPKPFLTWLGPPNETIPLLPSSTMFSIPFRFISIEEEEVMEHAASHLQSNAIEANAPEAALRCSSCSRGSSVLSPQSSPTTTPNISSLALSQNPSTPLHSVQSTPLQPGHASQLAGESTEERLFSPLVDELGASSTSSDFVFTIVPPSTSDVDSVVDLGSPLLRQDDVTDSCLSPVIPFAAGSTQTALSSPSPPASPIPRSGEKQSGLEDVLDSGTSLEVADEAKIGDIHVSEPIASPALAEDPRPTVQEFDKTPSPVHFRSLSDITEITEPSDSSDSTPGTPRVAWFSGIPGGLASLDDRDLRLQVAHDVTDTTASTPEVDAGFNWSQVGVPSSMEDFLPLSTSTPNLQSTASWQPESTSDSPRGDVVASQVQLVSSPRLQGDLMDVGTPGLLTAPPASAASLLDAGAPSAPSSIDYLRLEDGDDKDQWSFEDRTAIPPAASAEEATSGEERSLSQYLAMTADEATQETPVPTVVSPAVAQTFPTPSSPGGSCLPPTFSEAPVMPTAPMTNPTDTSLDRRLQTGPVVSSDRATPTVTHVRRASRVLVARTGLAGQQVALTDAGLARLVARLDEPLPPEEDVRGERRRMELVTTTAMAKHSADRGEPRDAYQVINERRYSNEPISARVERDIINAAQHPPLRNDPHIRVPVLELGRSRSSSRVRSTTNVALVRRSSISTSSQDIAAVAASPLILPQTWGHRRSQSEVASTSRADQIVGDREPRLSYAAIAARGLQSRPLRLPVVSNEPSEPSSSQNVSKSNESTARAIEAARSRTVSAPVVSMSPEFRNGHFDIQASWRNGNRWSVLAAPAPPSPAESVTLLGKGKARLQEPPSATMTTHCPVPLRGSPVLEKRWPQSRLLKAPTQAPSDDVVEAPQATWLPLPSIDNDPRPSGSGASKLHGSMLSATCRVKLRDLALSAQQSIASPPLVVGPAPCVASGSASVSDPPSGFDASPGSGSSSTSSESVDIVCTGATCVPVSFVQSRLVVTDTEAPAVERPKADLVEASDDHLATSRVAPTCAEDRSQLGSLWLLPTRSTTDMQSSDESVDLVIASQECQPPTPTGDCPAVVRLNSRSTPLAVPSSSHSRRSTAPAHVPFLSTSVMGGSSSPASAAFLFRCDLVPQGEAVPTMRTMDQSPSLDLPRPPTRRRDGPPRAFTRHRRAMSSTLPEQKQRSIHAAGFTWRGMQRG